MPLWFVTTMTGRSAFFQRWIASAAPGIRTSLSTSTRRTWSTLSVPSRSTKTAARLSKERPLDLVAEEVEEHLVDLLDARGVVALDGERVVAHLREGLALSAAERDGLRARLL